MTGVADPTFASSPAADFVEVAVISHHVQVDLVLPRDVPVAQLIPALSTLVQCGEGSGEDGSRSGDPEGASRNAWTLRRPDSESPMSPDATLREAGVSTNGLLVLESTRTLAVPMLYDDVVDAAARLNRGELPGWSAAVAGRAALAGASLVSAIWVYFVLSPSFSHDRVLMAGLSAAVFITLVGLATWANRVAARPDVGATLGWCAVAIAAASTWVSLSGLGEYALGAGSAAMLVLSWMTARAVGAGRSGHLAGMIFFGAGALLLLTLAAGVAPPAIGAVIAAAGAVSGLLVPRWTAHHLVRSGKVRGSKAGKAANSGDEFFADPFDTPANDSDSDRGGGTPPVVDLWAVTRRRAADRAGVYAGLALATCIGLIATIGWAVNWPGAMLLSLTCACLFATSCRTACTAVERVTLAVSATLLLVISCLWVGDSGDVSALASFGILTAGTAASAIIGKFIPRTTSPATSRVLVCLHYLLVAAIVPLAMWVAGPLDAWVRP